MSYNGDKRGSDILAKVFENLSKEDVYNIIVPVVLAVVPIIEMMYTILSNKIRPNSRKSSQDWYATYLLKCLGIALFTMQIGAVISTFTIALTIQWWLNEIPEIVMSIFRIIVTIILFIIWFYRSGKDIEEIKLNKEYKYENVIKYWMFYAPKISSACIFVVWPVFLEKIYNIAFIGLAICEAMLFYYLENDKLSLYSRIELYFEDQEKVVCLVENFQEKGDWIIVKNKTKGTETRYKKEKLVKAMYFD